MYYKFMYRDDHAKIYECTGCGATITELISIAAENRDRHDAYHNQISEEITELKRLVNGVP